MMEQEKKFDFTYGNFNKKEDAIVSEKVKKNQEFKQMGCIALLIALPIIGLFTFVQEKKEPQNFSPFLIDVKAQSSNQVKDLEIKDEIKIKPLMK